jgi:hypothetical protein
MTQIAAVIIALPQILGHLLDSLRKFVFSRTLGRIRQRLLRGPGAWVMGCVIRSAFGEDVGKCEEVSWLPEGARSETMTDELSQRMCALAEATAAESGRALYSALAEGDALQVKKHIISQLSNARLAHCQYYVEPEIVRQVAELIASTPKVELPPEPRFDRSVAHKSQKLKGHCPRRELRSLTSAQWRTPRETHCDEFMARLRCFSATESWLGFLSRRWRVRICR